MRKSLIVLLGILLLTSCASLPANSQVTLTGAFTITPNKNKTVTPDTTPIIPAQVPSESVHTGSLQRVWCPCSGYIQR